MDSTLTSRIASLLDTLSPCKQCPATNTEAGINLPGQKSVIRVLELLVEILYPGCHGHNPLPHDKIADHIRKNLTTASDMLVDQCSRAFAYQCKFEKCNQCDDCKAGATKVVDSLLADLPKIRAMLHDDIRAAYEGDPAARSTMEIVISYPGIYAITVQRIAHKLYDEGVPLIPRAMCEFAHSKTGIDIHPGAHIGPGFFIDHGTGVVIGETCVIGRNVKLYQGVTLGALSFDKDEKGRLVKGTKRHPKIEDNVIIYAGATLLGGETTIGKGSVIGGNVWLTHSVPAHSRVYNQQPGPIIHNEETTKQEPAAPTGPCGQPMLP